MRSDILIGKWCNVLRRFCGAERGNVILTFALMLIPIMAGIGAAVDYSRANDYRSQLQAAADAAAIGSVGVSSAAVKAAGSMSSDGAIPAGVTDALNIFNAQLVTKTAWFRSLKSSAKVTKKNGSITSVISFSAKVPTLVMALFGKKTVTVKGTATAATATATYIDFYLLLDNTPSMGVGATTADINTMVNNTPDQCAFACHDLSTYPNDYYSKAKSLGVKMRIDVLRDATQSLMDTAKATESNPNQFGMAIYTFGTSCTNTGFSSVQTLTSNLATAKTAAGTIDLMTTPYQGYNNDQCTSLDDVLTDMNSTISAPGSGTTASSPQKYLFFVADGVADADNPVSCAKPLEAGTRCQEPIDPSFCTTLKSRGIKIAVLYTTYLPLPTNAWYNTWIAPFQSEIPTKMQSCASPGLYFEVSPSQGISDAMNALFKKAVSEAHLTQ